MCTPMAATLPRFSVHPVKPLMRNASMPKSPQRPNQNLFEIAHVTKHVFAIRTQIDYWISDDLAQARDR